MPRCAAGERMMSSDDDLFGKDAMHDADDDEFERHGRALHELVADYLEEHDIPDSAGSVLLLNGAITMRMIGYATDVEKPSGSGLKRESDTSTREAAAPTPQPTRGAAEI